MKDLWMDLIGEDTEYLQKLGEYWQAHRIMGCHFRVTGYEQALERMEQGDAVLTVIEGMQGRSLYERYKDKIPVLWITEGGLQEAALEKYQSARKLGEEATGVYRKFHRAPSVGQQLIGVFSLSRSDVLKRMCDLLRKNQDRALVVNLEFFTMFPGQRHRKYLNFSDFARNRTDELFWEDLLPYEMRDGLLGIQCPNSPEDYEDILSLPNLTGLMEYAAERNIPKVILYFGKTLIPWFPFAYHCHRLIGIEDGDDPGAKEWFLDFWKARGDGIPIQFSDAVELVIERSGNEGS